MQLVVDVDFHIAVQDIGNRSPVNTIGFKSQDTPALNVYLVSNGLVQDYGSAPVLKFGLISPPPADPTSLLVLDATFARQVDPIGQVFYQGFPEFDTSAVRALFTESVLLVPALGEIRYQLADGEIVHTLDIPFTIYRTILQESGSAAPVGTGAYPDVATIELKTNKDEPSGYAGLDSAGHLNPDVIPPGAYEETANKDIALGYAGLDSAGLIPVAEIPIDGTTIVIAAGKIAATGVATVTDFQTAVGLSLIKTATGVFNRILAGTGISFDNTTTPGAITLNVTPAVASLIDAETTTGSSLISVSTGTLKRIVAGTNIMLDTTTTAGAIIITSTAGGSSTSLTDAETTTGQTLISSSSGVLKRLIAGSGIVFDAVTTTGGVIISSNLADAETSAGSSIIASAGLLKRIIAGTNITLDIATTVGGIIVNAAGAALTDAETTTGQTLISSSAGVLKRLVAGTNVTFDTVTTPGAIIIASASGAGLTDAETTTGQTLISNSTGIIKRLVGGTNITLDVATTPGAIILNGTIGGSGVSALSDAETTTGATLIATTSGSIKRLVAGTNVSFDTATTSGAVIINDTGVGSLIDAETTTGSTLIGASTGSVKRLIAGTGVTLDAATTPGGVIVNTAASGGALTPDLGIEFFDDFLGAANFAFQWTATGSGTGPVANSTVGVSSTAKAAGVVDLPGGTTGASTRSELMLGGTGATGSNTAFVPRLGILTLTWRVWIPTLHTASDYTTLRIGMFSDDGSGTPQDGLWFSYVRATSVNWITNTMAATVTTATTSSTALTAAAWHKCTITTDATWANIVFAVDGTTLATMTTNVPANTKVTPIRFQSFKTLGATNQIASTDYMYMKYAYTVGR